MGKGEEPNRTGNIIYEVITTQIKFRKKFTQYLLLIELAHYKFSRKTNLVFNFHDFLTNIVLLHWSLVKKHCVKFGILKWFFVIVYGKLIQFRYSEKDTKICKNPPISFELTII